MNGNYSGLLGKEDIANLTDIYRMYSYIMTNYKLTPDSHLSALKTMNDLKKLLQELDKTFEPVD